MEENENCLVMTMRNAYISRYGFKRKLNVRMNHWLVRPSLILMFGTPEFTRFLSLVIDTQRKSSLDNFVQTGVTPTYVVYV